MLRLVTVPNGGTELKPYLVSGFYRSTPFVIFILWARFLWASVLIFIKAHLESSNGPHCGKKNNGEISKPPIGKVLNKWLLRAEININLLFSFHFYVNFTSTLFF